MMWKYPLNSLKWVKPERPTGLKPNGKVSRCINQKQLLPLGFCHFYFYVMAVSVTLGRRTTENEPRPPDSGLRLWSPAVVRTVTPRRWIQCVWEYTAAEPEPWALVWSWSGVPSSGLQLTQPTNRCHVCPSPRWERVQGWGLLWQWGLCAVPGASRCVLVYCFPLIFIWPLGWRLFFPFFPTNFLWGDYLWAAAKTYWFRWHDTHNTPEQFWWNMSLAATVTAVCREQCKPDCLQ